MTKITKELLSAWKAKGIVTYLLEVDLRDENEVYPDDDTSDNTSDEPNIKQDAGVYYCILKKPGRREIGLAQMAGSKDTLAMGESIIKNCWLDGDEEIKDLAYQDTIGVVASIQAITLMNVGQSSLKKL